MKSQMKSDNVCNLCGSKDSVLHLKSRKPNSANDWQDFKCTNVGHFEHDDILRCKNCGLIFQIQNESNSYASLYSDIVDEEYLELRESREKTFANSLKIVRSFITKGKMLDVACYYGIFSELAKKSGFEVEGLEPSLHASGYVREKLGIPVYTGTLEEIDPKGKPYDVVTMWDAIEHVADPEKAFDKCAEVLKKNGYLFFSTMDVEHVYPRYLKTRWPWYMNMHLFYFSPKTLKKYLEKSGFELISSGTYQHVIRFDYFVQKLQSFGFLGKFLSGIVGLSKINQKKIYLKFALGDFKYFVARKK